MRQSPVAEAGPPSLRHPAHLTSHASSPTGEGKAVRVGGWVAGAGGHRTSLMQFKIHASKSLASLAFPEVGCRLVIVIVAVALVIRGWNRWLVESHGIY